MYGGAGGRLAERLGLRVWVRLVCGGSPVLCLFLRDSLARRRCFLGLAGLVLSCAYCRLVLCFLGLLLLPFRSLFTHVTNRAHASRVHRSQRAYKRDL